MSNPGQKINFSIKKDQGVVKDTYDMEDLGNGAAFCRCWRSKKFPYCDGSHLQHNKDTGDNVGPIVISSRRK